MLNFKYYNTSTLIIFILVLSIPAALLIEAMEPWVSTVNQNIPWLGKILDYMGLPLSVVGLISLMLFVVNRWGWKWKIFKWLIDIPDMSGRYTGEYISSYKDSLTGGKTRGLVAIEITQTASAIHVYSYNADPQTGKQKSRSESISEEIKKQANGFFKLYFIFENKGETLEQLYDHSGMVRLDYFPDNKTLRGDYYNQRQNIGTIEVKYQQKKLLGRYS